MALNDSILLLTDEMEPGGVARHVADIANGLVERGIVPVVAASDGPFRSRLRAEVEFIDLPLFSGLDRRKRLLGFLGSYRMLARVIRQKNIRLVHSHKRYTDILGRMLARRRSLPHVSTCHNTFATLKQFSVFGDVTIACSKSAEQMLITDFRIRPEKLVQIYSGIHPFREFTGDEKKRVRQELHIAEGKKIVASVGQLIASKDRSALICAIGNLQKRRRLDNIIFTILGDGEQKETLNQLVKQEGVRESVIFLPGTYSVEALFNVADFMVLSSKQEGLPYVLLEAASLGKPHIATDVGGVSEFVSHEETGLLVPHGSPGQLADAIARLLNNGAEAIDLGRKAKEKFDHQFTFDRFIGRMVQFYEQYLQGR